MELLQYWKIVRKRLGLILLIMLVAGAGATAYSLRQVPVYRTTTRLFLNPGASSALLPYYIGSSSESLATTYAQYMRTRTYAELVVEEIGGEISGDGVLQAISTRYVPNQFFDITASHTDPALAQRLANTAAKVFIAGNLARQQAQQEQVRSQEDPVKVLERERLRQLQQNLDDEIDYYTERITGLEAQIVTLEANPASQQRDEQLLDLREELIRNQSLRVETLSSMAQAQAALVGQSEELIVDTAVVIDEASFPQPLPQQTLQTILVALIAALGLGVGLAFLLEYLDYTIKTPEELDAAYGMPTLGVTGMIKSSGRNGNKGGQESELITVSEPRSPISEAFRALRTNIQFANPEGTIRSLLVTSAGPSEGKTLTTANLAVVLAQSGKQVILVDGDLRKPRVHRVFGLVRAPGLSNLIIDREADVERYLQATEVDNLRILACGMQPPNPAELLGSPRGIEVMELLKEHADMVIYDTPPAATVTDAVILSTRVDAVLQVVKAGQTRRDLVLQGKRLLEKVGANILGPVLNQVNIEDLGYYSYYYYYGGYYSDGGEYGDDGQDDSGKKSKRGSHSKKRGRGLFPRRSPKPGGVNLAESGDA